MLQCAINVSEGRLTAVLDALCTAAGPVLVDLHCDADHHRSVLTLLGEAAEVVRGAVRLADRARALVTLTGHHGVHPRFGAIDVVPFTPFLSGRTPTDVVHFDEAIAAASAFVHAMVERGQAIATYGLGGTFETLPSLRRHLGGAGDVPAGTGVIAVGVRDVLVAYNVAVAGLDRDAVVDLAGLVRRPGVRTLGLVLGGQGRDARCQVSCNVVEPFTVTLASVYDAVAANLPSGAAIGHGELVGLLPSWALDTLPPKRWGQLGVDPSATLEARLGNGRR